jgi:malonyl-CoA/methylmalonyl-CoA synthetase
LNGDLARVTPLCQHGTMPDLLLPFLWRSLSKQIAVRFTDRSLTYPELASAANVVAHEIEGMTRVAVLAESRIETCVAVVAALLSGVTATLINPASGSSELAHIASDAAPDAVLLCPGTPKPLGFRDCPSLTVEIGLPIASALDWREPPPDAAALVIYTSGTTGPPKGAVLPRRSITTNLDALGESWAWTETDVVAHALPLFHVHGLVLGILGPLRRGGTAWHLGKFSPDAVERALGQGATMFFGVPTMYRRLADAAESSPSLASALGSARLLVSGSAALPASEHRRLERITGSAVVERYGMTETLMNSAVRVDGERRAGFVGPPLRGVDIRLVDDSGRPLFEPDEETIGEIEVRGPNLFLGYLNRPDATAASMRGGWFRTGDLATISADGYLRIVGRISTDLIKSGGYKIGAGEIEAALLDHASVDDVAVTGQPDPDLGERVVAWVVLSAGKTASEEELISYVGDQLAPHKRPREVHFVSELPRNDLGKVQKQRLAGVLPAGPS